MIPENIIKSFYYNEAKLLNNANIKHLSNINLDFNNKTILETGCGGIGDYTQFLLSNSAIVTLNDFRQENINSLMININKKLVYNTWDFNELVNCNDKFDIVFCYGLLYHLTNLENVFKNLSNLCNEFTVINTCTNGKNNEIVDIVFEGNSNEQSSSQYGSRPGRLFIWNQLKKNFEYVYCIKSQPDNIDYPLSFPSDHHASRNIFIGSHIKLNNENLIEQLLNDYTILY